MSEGSHKERSRSRIFRRVSLDRLHSPERLDELMQIIGPRSWIALATLAALVLGGLLWSVFGRIPVSVEGRGVLIHPRQVVDLQSTVSGTLQEFNLKAGQIVKEGDLLGVLDHKLLYHQLELKREELTRRQKHREESASLHSDRVAKERQSLEAERKLLKRQIAESRTQADKLSKANEASLAERRKSLEEQLTLFREMGRRLEERVKRYEKLEKRGVVSKQDILLLEQTTLNTLLTSQNLQTQLQDLSLTEIKERDQDMTRRHRILDLENRLLDVDRRESLLAEQTSEFAHVKEEPVEALQDEIARLEKQLAQESRILSPHTGRVLEVNARKGEVVTSGTRLAVLEIEEKEQPLVSLTCFAIKDGKLLQAGLPVQVSPDTVQRERYGSLLGSVESVGSFPVTASEVIKLVGNEEVARSLALPQGSILVIGKLNQAPTPSGYAWSSSRGPEQPMTAGTTTRTRVVVEQRSPLSFVLPILRSSTGTE